MARLTMDEFDNCVNTNPRRLRQFYGAMLKGKAHQRVLGTKKSILLRRVVFGRYSFLALLTISLWSRPFLEDCAQSLPV